MNEVYLNWIGWWLRAVAIISSIFYCYFGLSFLCGRGAGDERRRYFDNESAKVDSSIRTNRPLPTFVDLCHLLK